MPRNGSGTYALPQAAFVSGTTISSSAVNSNLSDIAGQLTNSVAADGQTALTGNLNLGTHAITGATNITASGTVAAGAVTVNSVALPALLRGYIDGLTLSRVSATQIGVQAGVATDSTSAATIRFGSSFTKSTAGTWVAGTFQNGMGVALTITNTAWYHVFAIIKAGAADIYIDTSASAANKPVGTTYFRRIGSFLTNGSAQIIAFTQIGDRFVWSVPVNNYTTAGLDTTPAYAAATVPTGVVVEAQMNGYVYNGSSQCEVLIYSTYAAPQAAQSPSGNAQFTVLPAEDAAGSVSILTDTSGGVYVVSTASNTALDLVTTGWIDRRGKE